jgi:hypothetical protein
MLLLLLLLPGASTVLSRMTDSRVYQDSSTNDACVLEGKEIQNLGALKNVAYTENPSASNLGMLHLDAPW